MNFVQEFNGPALLENAHLRRACHDWLDLNRGHMEVMEFYPVEDLFPNKSGGQRVELLKALISDITIWWTGIDPDFQKDPKRS